MMRAGSVVGSIFCSVLILLAITCQPSMAQRKAAGDKALGQYLSAECVTCHQLSGKSVGAIPPIIGIDAESFSAMMQAYKARQRENAVMQIIAEKLVDDEIAALAAYFGSLKPQR
jgi:cytochrome c553